MTSEQIKHARLELVAVLEEAPDQPFSRGSKSHVEKLLRNLEIKINAIEKFSDRAAVLYALLSSNEFKSLIISWSEAKRLKTQLIIWHEKNQTTSDSEIMSDIKIKLTASLKEKIQLSLSSKFFGSTPMMNPAAVLIYGFFQLTRTLKLPPHRIIMQQSKATSENELNNRAIFLYPTEDGIGYTLKLATRLIDTYHLSKKGVLLEGVLNESQLKQDYAKIQTQCSNDFLETFTPEYNAVMRELFKKWGIGDANKNLYYFNFNRTMLINLLPEQLCHLLLKPKIEAEIAFIYRLLYNCYGYPTHDISGVLNTCRSALISATYAIQKDGLSVTIFQDMINDNTELGRFMKNLIESRDSWGDIPQHHICYSAIPLREERCVTNFSKSDSDLAASALLSTSPNATLHKASTLADISSVRLNGLDGIAGDAYVNATL